MNITVLGASGFIGTHLVEFLYKTTDANLLLFSRSRSKYLDSLKLDTTRVKTVLGDFKNEENLDKILKGQDLVYHMISGTFPSRSWQEPLLELSENLAPTIKLIEACARNNIKKICYISSGGTVYGRQGGVINENHQKQPFSPYGIIKSTIEDFLEYGRVKYDLAIDVYRFSNPYGPRQETFLRGLGVIPTWLNSILKHKPITIFGEGEIIRDYIYIEDAVKLIGSSVTRSLHESDTFNIGSGQSLSLKQLHEKIIKIVDLEVVTQYKEGREQDNKVVLLDNKKILNYFPDFVFTSIAEGLAQTWSWIKTSEKVENE